MRLDPRQWYFYDLSYWGLDYPPLTAYHSLFLGFCARLSHSTARFVTLRPPATSSVTELKAWDEYMSALEVEGSLKLWMRASVVIGDAMVYLSAVVRYCTRNCRAQAGDDRSGHSRYRGRIERRMVRPCICHGYQSKAELVFAQLAAVLTIGLQPALLLIDNGHFQCVSRDHAGFIMR